MNRMLLGVRMVFRNFAASARGCSRETVGFSGSTGDRVKLFMFELCRVLVLVM